MPNTRFSYLYRDGFGAVNWGEVIFAGEPSELELRRLRQAFEGEEFFIADQLRLPEVWTEGWPGSNDDHCWHSFHLIASTEEFTSDVPARTFADFVAEVERAKREGWREFDGRERGRRR